jgi:hypothetical protein
VCSSTSTSATSSSPTNDTAQSVTSSSSVDPQPEPVTSKPPREVCRMFLAGRCRLKNRCRWSHDSPVRPVRLEMRFLHMAFGLTINIRWQPRYHLQRLSLIHRAEAMLPSRIPSRHPLQTRKLRQLEVHQQTRPRPPSRKSARTL